MSDTLAVYSVPMELHIIAESREDALALAHDFPCTVYSDEGDSGSLYVATDKPEDVDCTDDGAVIRCEG